MDYTVRSRTDGLEVDVPDPGDRATALIETIESCCEGTCDCPSDEVRKVSSVVVGESFDGHLTMTLESAADLDIVEVDKAVHWAVGQIEE